MNNGDFGIGAIGSYDNFRKQFGRSTAETSDLSDNLVITDGFYLALTGAGYSCNFYYKNTESWAIDFEPASSGGGSDIVADDVDLVFWAGRAALSRKRGLCNALAKLQIRRKRWAHAASRQISRFIIDRTRFFGLSSGGVQTNINHISPQGGMASGRYSFMKEVPQWLRSA